MSWKKGVVWITAAEVLLRITSCDHFLLTERCLLPLPGAFWMLLMLQKRHQETPRTSHHAAVEGSSPLTITYNTTCSALLQISPTHITWIYSFSLPCTTVFLSVLDSKRPPLSNAIVSIALWPLQHLLSQIISQKSTENRQSRTSHHSWSYWSKCLFLSMEHSAVLLGTACMR